jgi:ABC-2 type transport system permease protein
VKINLPPPLEVPPPPQSFSQDFKLLTKNQMRVTWNKWRHRPKKTLILTGFLLVGLVAFIIYLGSLAYGALGSVSFELGQGILSLLFMSGLVAQIFFGITAAFTSLYMSEDLELLFMAPVSLKAVFAVKSLSVLVSNLVTAVLFVLLPGVFYGLLFQAAGFFYLLVILITLGLLVIGTALAELLNLLIMRIVPPHRSKEAVGFIGAVAGIMIALMFQIPSMMMGREEQFDIGSWLAGNAEILQIMNFFPWGWGSRALVAAISGNGLSGLAWSLLILLMGVFLFGLAFSFVERGFRRGFISLSQGEGGRRRKTKRKGKELADVMKPSPGKEIFAAKPEDITNVKASVLTGIWAVAKKDLLYLKRDTREWFGYLTPLIIMAFFIAQYLLGGSEASRSSLITVFIMYTVMFSGNMALQSFGREGESDWLLNSVPLTGWPVVFGKLLASVLPTLVLMEALLVGTGIAIGLSFSIVVAFAVGAVLLSLGSSAIGLFYSINNSRYNPESPQHRIAPGASMIMYLINLVFILFLALGVVYIFRPTELIAILQKLPPVTYEGGFLSAVTYGLYLLSRPLLWPAWAGTLTGILVTGGVWSGMFFGFMAATVRQSLKGFRVEIVAGKKKKKR